MSSDALNPVHRLLDAAANRGREAIRVMEDAARFILDDAELSGGLKQLRHDLASALAGLPIEPAARDTPGDVGTAIATAAESDRASAREVVIASGKRLSEALRSLEEYAKTIDPDVARAIEQLRYRGYDLEQRMNDAMTARRRAPQWRLCVLITESLCAGRDWRDVARQAVAGGADCLQLREKDLDGGELLTRARQMIEIASGRAAVIINDRVDIALASGADGVHLGQHDLPCRAARRIAGDQLLIGVSTANLEQAKRAQSDGAAYCGVGPMFPSRTKAKPTLAGLAYLREYVAWGQLPHLAISGIDPDRAAEIASAGGRGVAVSSAACGAPDVAAAVRDIAAALPQSLPPSWD